MIPIYKPYLPPKSLKYAHDAIDSGWISWHGKYCDIVTQKLQEILNIKHVLLVANGTCACHLMAKCLSRKYSEVKKIYVPDNVYVASWNAFLFDKQFELKFGLVDLDTWNSIPDKVDDSSAVLVVHNLGNVVNVPDWRKRHPNILVVEDACEAFGGKYNGLMTGTAGLCSAFSFFGNKTITCGEGGAFVTNDDDLFEYAKKFSRQGQSDKQYIHDMIGTNYRMTNIQAAILCGQLEILDEILAKKNYLFDRYKNGLKDIEKISFQKHEPGTIHAKWMFGIRLSGSTGYDYAKRFMNRYGIDIRPMFYPASSHAYLNIKSSRSSYVLSKEAFMLPSYPSMTDKEIDLIIEVLKKIAKVSYPPVKDG